MSTSAMPTEPDPFITVVSHTGLLYWWPVWLVGFILSGLTWLESNRLAIVPEGTKIKSADDKVYELTVPDRAAPSLAQAADTSAKGQDPFPVCISANRNYGMVYVVVLLLVAIGSNVPLRGVWSLVAILFVLVVTLLLAGLGLWDDILARLGGLHIEISLAGYLLPSVVLLLVWVVTVFGFDRLRFIHFTAGQFIVRKDIGDAREIYDTTRVTVRKRRSDLFRHWVLGFGTGDLIINVPGQGKEIVLPDALFHANVTRNHTCPDMDSLMVEVRDYLKRRWELLLSQTANTDKPQNQGS